jgi:hypothetical protein
METTGPSEWHARGDSRRKRPQPRSYLLKADYRELGLSDLPLDDTAAQDLLEKARWGALGRTSRPAPIAAPLPRTTDTKTGRSGSVAT